MKDCQSCVTDSFVCAVTFFFNIPILTSFLLRWQLISGTPFYQNYYV
jgi:hypothetical protein